MWGLDHRIGTPLFALPFLAEDPLDFQLTGFATP